MKTLLAMALVMSTLRVALSMTEDECDAFYRLDEREKAHRFASMSEKDKWDYTANAVRRLNDLTLEPPRMITETLPRYGYDRNDYALNVGLAVTKGGRVWVSWIGGEDGPTAFLLGAYSDDGGKTFGPPAFVVDSRFEGARLFNIRVNRPVVIGDIWAAPDGSLRVYVNAVVQGWDGRGATWEFICRNPDAKRPVWEKPRYLWHGDQHNKPEVTRDGTWLLPVDCGYSHAFPRMSEYSGCTLLASTDQGNTWMSLGTSQPRDVRRIFSYCEPMVVELSDGRLHMLVRTDDCLVNPMGAEDLSSMIEVYSADGGRTWSKPVRTKRIEQIMSRFAYRRLRNGHLLFVKNGTRPTGHPVLTEDERSQKNPWVLHYTQRRELTAFVSDDDGKTWKGGLLLEPQAGMASYPDAQETEDGAIWVSYDFERSYDGQIRISRFTETEVLAGKISSPESYLGRVAIRPAISKRERKENNRAGKIITDY